MTRTERADPNPSKAPKNASTASSRRSQISRSLSKLLRHQAENEKIPISPAGWVKVDDLMAWRGLERIGKGITLLEIFEVVEEDGRVGKGRFDVKFLGESQGGEDGRHDDGSVQVESTVQLDSAADKAVVDDVSRLLVGESTPQVTTPLDPTSKNTPSTQAAIQHHNLNPTTPSTLYLIRATQGHSIKTIESSSLLTPLTLSTPNLPNNIVHGTFYGAWPAILSTGGLKPMGRNNVHFATGPPLDEAMNLVSSEGKSSKAQVDDVLSRNKVVSGMRWDAQLLIYVDLKRCLEDVAARGLDMQWWISGNGVVLTEGVTTPPPPPPPPPSSSSSQIETSAEAIDNSIEDSIPMIASKSAKMKKHNEIVESQSQNQRIVPMEYWTAVVEIKNGLGVIWKEGQGVVKELPERLMSMGLPQGKGRGGRGGNSGRGSGRSRGRGRGGNDRKVGLGKRDEASDGNVDEGGPVGGSNEE